MQKYKKFTGIEQLKQRKSRRNAIPAGFSEKFIKPYFIGL
jgi:hypothetical protein